MKPASVQSEPRAHAEAVLVRADGLGRRMFDCYHGESLLERWWRGERLRLPLAQALPPGSGLSVRLDVEQSPFLPSDGLRAALREPMDRMQRHPHRHDGTLTALTCLHSEGAGYVGSVAPVSYFHARCTEQLLDSGVDLRRADQPAEGRLPAFSASQLACDIGVVVLLETSDGATVVQRRGRHLDWRGGLLSVSASGSLEPGRDFAGRAVDLGGLLAGARRELAEEVGVGGALDPQADRLRLESLGLWRELARGGKPELYAAAWTPLSFDEVVRLQARAPDAHESSQVAALSREGVRELLDGVCAQPVLDGIDLALVAGLLLRASSLSEERAVE